MAEPAVVDRPRSHEALRQFLELMVLCSFAIAQPLLDVTGRSPETFVFFQVAGLEVVAYAVLLLLVPPVLLWLVVIGLGVVAPAVGRATYVVVAAALVGLTVLVAAKKFSALRGPLLVVAAALVAVGVVWLFARNRVAQSFLTYLTPAPVVFALLFVFASPTAPLVRSAEASEPAGGDGDGGPKPPVVMLLLDELPLMSLLDSHGQVDERVFPNFARLAHTSHWFRNGTSISPFTQQAVPAMLSGRYPREEAAPSYVRHPDNLFSLLAPDYRIRAFESITQLCDPAYCDDSETGSDRGLAGLFGQTWRVAKALTKPYDDAAPIWEQFAEQPAGRVRPASRADPSRPVWEALKANQPKRFQRFFAGLRPREAPTLHFLHLLLPHHPWRYLPSGVTYPDKILGGVKGGWDTYAWPLEVDRQALMLQLAYVDRLLGEVIDRLKRRGIWDDALVVVTADHGESFVAGSSGRRLTRQPESQAQLAWVPVFVKEPGQSRGTTSDANWEQVDLLPTIADVLGITIPFKVDGISALSHTRGRTEKYFYAPPGRRIDITPAPGFRIVKHGLTDTFVRGSQGQDGLYVTGSRPDWIGHSVASLTSLGVDVEGPPSPMRARLADELDVDSVDPASGEVPALVRGTLRRSAGRGPVLIAVNGTAAAISEIYPQDGKPAFAGFVNDKLFTGGKNDVALYEIVGDADPQLRPIKVR